MKLSLLKLSFLAIGIGSLYYYFSQQDHSHKLSSSNTQLSNAIQQIYKNIKNTIDPFSSWHFYSPTKKRFIKAEKKTIHRFKNQRIAIVVHGLFCDASDMRDIARFLTNYKQFDPKLKKSHLRYNFVLAYDYNTAPAIKKIALQFAQDLHPLLNQFNKIELFAHSLGGLVCRWALEKENLGRHIKRLVTLGTPHEGIPTDIIKEFLSILPKNLFSLSDLSIENNHRSGKKLSNFLRLLNHGTSPFKANAKYYTIAGINPKFYMNRLGNIIQKKYSKMGSIIKGDGLVAECSANSNVLESKSSLWQRNTSCRKTLPINHLMMLGSSDQLASQKIVTTALEDWMQHWPLD